MNRHNRGNFYGSHNYSSRSNSNSYSEDGPGAKRRRYRPGKKNQAAGIEPLFREPVAPTPGRSPRQGGGLRDNPFRSKAGYGTHQDSQFFDFVDSPYSQPTWYWDNYHKSCQSWQEKHQLAYYRSRCLALEFENQMLFQQISSLIEENCIFAEERGEMPSMRLPEFEALRENMSAAKPTQADNKQMSNKEQSKNKPKVKSSPADADSTNSKSPDLDYEVDQSLMDGMETTLRHKIGLKKLRKKEETENMLEAKLKVNGTKVEDYRKQTAAERQEEMDQLYGKDSSQIYKLETSLQLKFNRFCDTHKPELWMATPLNPQTVAIE